MAAGRFAFSMRLVSIRVSQVRRGRPAPLVGPANTGKLVRGSTAATPAAPVSSLASYVANSRAGSPAAASHRPPPSCLPTANISTSTVGYSPPTIPAFVKSRNEVPGLTQTQQLVIRHAAVRVSRSRPRRGAGGSSPRYSSRQFRAAPTHGRERPNRLLNLDLQAEHELLSSFRHP